MPRRTSKIALSVLTAGLLMAGLNAAFGSASGAAPAPSTGASPVSASPIGPPKRVTLVTGDVVLVSTQPDGQQKSDVMRANRSGPSALFRTFRLGSDLYVVPQSAIPYLGSTMDLALFDVTKLAAGPASVQITYRHGASAVPGLQVTHDSGNTAQAVATRQSGRAFGAALAKQWLADHGSRTHTTGLFANVARISSPATRPPAPHPNYPMHTLTVNGIDAHGRKDTGDEVDIVNLDDMRRFVGMPIWGDGVAKVSVPAGHYAAVSFFFEGDDRSATIHLVTLPQFTVTGDSSVTLDARSATVPVSVTTPRPAKDVADIVGVTRDDPAGLRYGGGFAGEGVTKYYVEPTSKPVTIGKLYYYLTMRMFSPAGEKSPYTYDLAFPSTGAIPADQHYVVHDSDLATVDSSYAWSHTTKDASDARQVWLPWQEAASGDIAPMTAPAHRTEYYTARPDVGWLDSYFPASTDDAWPLGELEGALVSYAPGTSHSTTWGGGPAHPRLLEGSSFELPRTWCPACISGSRLDVLSFPFSDNSPEHFGLPDYPAPGLKERMSYAIYADDVPIEKDSWFPDAEVNLPSGTQRVRIDDDEMRSSALNFTRSTDVHTRWTVPVHIPTAKLPTGWVCTYRHNSPTNCRVLPLITSSYDLPVNLLDVLPHGPVNGTVNLGHLAGMKAAFTKVTAQISYDSGKTWHAATVTDQGSGKFGLGFTVPASGTNGFGALKISATDALGGTFDQTIQHAFAV